MLGLHSAHDTVATRQLQEPQRRRLCVPLVKGVRGEPRPRSQTRRCIRGQRSRAAVKLVHSGPTFRRVLSSFLTTTQISDAYTGVVTQPPYKIDPSWLPRYAYMRSSWSSRGNQRMFQRKRAEPAAPADEEMETVPQTRRNRPAKYLVVEDDGLTFVPPPVRVPLIRGRRVRH